MQISNFQFPISNFKRKKGFTLLEFTVVIGVLMLAIGSTLAILQNILRTSNQTNITSEVKQNGQVILDSLERQIRNATGIECKDVNGAVVACDTVSGASPYYIKLLRQNQDPLHIKCFGPTPSPTPTANGYIGIHVSQSPNPSPGLYIPVSNTDPVAGVDVTGVNVNASCTLTVIKATSGSGSPAAVTVDFTINQGVQAASRQDFQANVQFRTTISLRNY